MTTNTQQLIVAECDKVRTRFKKQPIREDWIMGRTRREGGNHCDRVIRLCLRMAEDGVDCPENEERLVNALIVKRTCIHTPSPEHEINVIQETLLEKNRKYGDSAINPTRIFSKADPVEQINVRIDDKISRIRSAQSDDTEDAELDLIGYLILKRVALAGVGTLTA